MLRRKFPEGVFLRGKQANPENFMKYAPHSRIIHIISHTHAPHTGFAGGIQMGDGSLLTAYEISLMKIPAKLVALATCSSAKGGYLRFSGDPETITYAFLLAGAEKVISSYTPLEDSASYAFFSHFYSIKNIPISRRFNRAFSRTLSEGIPLPYIAAMGLYE